MRIAYTPTALRQLDDILTYIEGRHSLGAIRVKARVRDLIAVLADHPFAGQSTSRPGQRRLVISPYPYVIFYRVGADTLTIQRVRHTARRPL